MIILLWKIGGLSRIWPFFARLGQICCDGWRLVNVCNCSPVYMGSIIPLLMKSIPFLMKRKPKSSLLHYRPIYSPSRRSQ